MIMVLRCNLKELREYARMTQAELALKSDVHINMISDYENNRSTPTIYTLWRLALALDRKVDEIYSVIK
jgi:transcriptional regulator with XRE-family HTH domain